MPKQAQKYECKICDYVTSKKSNIDNHFATKKHKKEMMEQENKNMEIEIKPAIICSVCNIKYLTKSGLWKHFQKHHNEKEPITVPVQEPSNQEQKNNLVLDTATVLQLIKQNDDFKTLIVEQNQEFKALLLEQQNKIIDLAGKPNTNNNTVNNYAYKQ